MKPLFSSKNTWLIFLLAALSLVVYLLAARLMAGNGFPLDDAWIHQTYARNLGLLGQWAYVPGEASGGSTSPLWTVLLAIGHFMRLTPQGSPLPWTYFLGWVCLAAVALAGIRLFVLLCPKQKLAAVWVGVFLAFEWHLVWAAGSGMETLLMALTALLVLGECLSSRPHWFAMGLLVGGSMWVRPDGLMLLGPVSAVLVLNIAAQNSLGWRQRLGWAWNLAVGLAMTVPVYLVFNVMIDGSVWPNTFFAKQTEYAAMTLIPYWQRWLNLNSLPLVGAGALLLPGFGLWLVRAVQRRAWRELTLAAWLLGYLAIYAWRLPVTYQHGRYLIPAMPLYFILGLSGMADWLKLHSRHIVQRVISRAWAISTGLTLAGFWLFGARAYAIDTAIIETEMVATARWVSENTPAQALVAAHDIGALGYFAQRPLIDLAGLISPEVIPFIRDENRLASYLDQHDAEYLVTFPGWYRTLDEQAVLIYQTDGKFSPQEGGENMAVFRWHP